MGFTDYLSRNPHLTPPPISADDELLVINRIREFTFTLVNEERKHNTSTNQNAPFGQTQKSHDVINEIQRTQNNANAFCHFFLITKQSLSFSLSNSTFQNQNFSYNNNPTSNNNPSSYNINPSSKLNNFNSFQFSNNITPHSIHKNSHNQYPNSRIKINVVTRKKPNFNTFDRPMVKRTRKPNKRKAMNPLIPNIPIPVATQTDANPPCSNVGQGLESIDESKHAPLFEFENEIPPDYCRHLSRVFGEEFLTEATLKDKNLQSIIRLVKTHKWDELKLISKYYYSLRNDLSVAHSGCLLYDVKLVIPYQLQNLVINAVHCTNLGQVGMIRLANLIWFPQIHRTIALRAENCRQCLDQGKNLKPIIPKSKLGQLPKLSQPNEEIQLDFAGPIVDRKNPNNEHYILAAVDRFSRIPSAVVHTNCDAQTAIEFLNQFCNFHGIPRSIRCDQAQAFKSRTFEIYCKEKNIKLIFSPTHDHRASGMMERLIQTLKRRLATMNIDPIWENTIIAEKTEIIESIRLIPNRVTKIPPFEAAHFGRPKNTELSNLITKHHNTS